VASIRNSILFLSVIALFIFLGYQNILNGEFIFDDMISIEDNLKIRGFDYFKNLGIVEYAIDVVSGTRPVVNLTFAVNYAIGRFNPFGYHIGNIIIHLLNSFLVYIFVYKTLNLTSLQYKKAAGWISFLAAIFFSLHPIQTGAVSYISQRAEILASFFYLLGLLFFVRGLLDASLKSHLSYAAGIICFLLGIGSKDIIITLPVMLFIYWAYFLRDLPNRKDQALKMGLLSIPVLLAIIYRFDSIRNNTRIGFNLEFSSYEYLLTQLRVIMKYIGLLALPVNQNADYDFAISKGFLNPPTTLISVIFILLLIILIVLLYRKWRIGSFALLWFFVILLPTSSFIPVIDVIFEHRVYLASLGFFLLFSLGLYHGYSALKAREKIRAYAGAFTVILLIASLTYFTAKRNMVWTSRIAYWEDVVHKSPMKARSYVSLGSAYQEKGLIDFAVAAFSKATNLADIKEKPNSILALALLYSEIGDYNKALSEIDRALRLSPINSPDLYYVVGTVYAKAGHIEQAVKSYKEALNRDPWFIIARYALGELYYKTGLYAEAIFEYRAILKIYPGSAKAYNDIGAVYAKQEMFDEAEKNFLLALKAEPNFVSAIKNLKSVAELRKKQR